MKKYYLILGILSLLVFFFNILNSRMYMPETVQQAVASLLFIAILIVSIAIIKKM